jgi:hypothetical protein
MPKLHELVTSDSLSHLFESSREALVALEAINAPRVKSKEIVQSGKWIIPMEQTDVSIPILKYVHQLFWNLGTPQRGLPGRYARISKGVYVADILRELNKDGLVGWNGPQVVRMAGQVLNVLHRNQLLERQGAGKSHTYLVAPWPGDESITLATSRKKVVLTEKDEAIVQRRLEEVGNAPVKVHFDIKTIPLPKPDPESVMEYVGKLVASYNRLSNQYEKVCTELGEAVEKLAQMEDQMTQLRNADEWDVAIQRIHNLVAGD